MISITRASATLALLLAAACGGSSDASNAAPVDPAGDTSQDELNTTARFTHLKKGPSDADLAAFSALGAKFDNAYLGTYRFNKAGPEKTDADARMKRVKEVMHRYMCSFFDESIDLAHTTSAKAALKDVNLDTNASDQSAQVAPLEAALTKVLADKKMDVMSGGASGNNTAGEIMGIYDVTHNEILFFGYTNCGSDN
jgi:hypothetical protein